MTKSNSLLITIDIDWAADWMIEDVLNTLDKYSCQALFFGTHKTPMNHEVIRRGHELGIHPNFRLTGENHLISNEIQRLLEDVNSSPHFIRSHCLRTDTLQLEQSFGEIATLRYDLSILTPGTSIIFQAERKLPKTNRMIRQINYHWEDSLFLRGSIESPMRFENRYLYGPTALNFHPIHIVTDAISFECYARLKQRHGTISAVKRTDIAACANKHGIGHIFESAIKQGARVDDYLMNLESLGDY